MRTWHSLVSSPLADDVLAAIQDIATDLAQNSADPDFGLSRQYPYSLGFGRAGISLFYAYLGACREDEPTLALAADCLDQSLQALSEYSMVPDLYRGFGGIAWTFEHVKDRLWGPLEDDPCLQVDDALATWSREGEARSELMHGLAGICVYALERRAQPSALELAELAVAGIDERARRPGGWGWPLPPEGASHLMGTYEREPSPRYAEILPDLRQLVTAEGVIRPGAAHGVAGILSALGAVHAHGVAVERTGRLLRESISWFLEQRLPEGSASVFPEFCHIRHSLTQSGWCNGDLGIAVSLFVAARCLGEPAWEREALAAARIEATRQVDGIPEGNRTNPILCHGFAGRMHLFNRLYQATGEEAFAEAARFWLRETLRLQRPGVGFGGFAAFDNGTLVPLRGFLMGSAGIGLALLAAVTDREPAWDCVLGASVPGLGIPS